MAMVCVLSPVPSSSVQPSVVTDPPASSSSSTAPPATATPSRVPFFNPALMSRGVSNVRGVVNPAAVNANIMPSSKPTNAIVVVGENEPPESILRRFKREVIAAGVIPECRRRRFFETSQMMRKRKTRALLKRRSNMKRRAAAEGSYGGGFRPFAADAGFRPRPGPPRRGPVRPDDPFAPKPVRTEAEEDAEFWGDDTDNELIFQ